MALDKDNPDVMNNLASLLHDIGLDHEALCLINRALRIERKPEYLDTYDSIVGAQPSEEDDGAAGPE
jgi:hypothetical protein